MTDYEALLAERENMPRQIADATLAGDTDRLLYLTARERVLPALTAKALLDDVERVTRDAQALQTLADARLADAQARLKDATDAYNRVKPIIEALDAAMTDRTRAEEEAASIRTINARAETLARSCRTLPERVVTDPGYAQALLDRVTEELASLRDDVSRAQ
ncbi:MAG: hypothetical protein GX446_08655 [Chthonomonadales bacterium]|nr:hypothetical protein [Chthonomonadales bacterium]